LPNGGLVDVRSQRKRSDGSAWEAAWNRMPFWLRKEACEEAGVFRTENKHMWAKDVKRVMEFVKAVPAAEERLARVVLRKYHESEIRKLRKRVGFHKSELARLTAGEPAEEVSARKFRLAGDVA